MRTLCIDIGGTNIKASVLGPRGEELAPMSVRPTPRPATPQTVLEAIEELAREAEADRVSVGFPGVVAEGIARTAPNLDSGWPGYPLAAELSRRLGKPVRAVNDADLAGLSLVEGRGVEMVLTLGTGMGSGLYVDGKLVPNLELAHHPFGDGRTYEQRISDRVLADIGVGPWKKRVLENIEQIRPIWNFRKLYLGGGNARHFRREELPDDVVLADNRAAVLAGIRLWD